MSNQPAAFSFEKYNFGTESIWNNLSESTKNDFLNAIRILKIPKKQIIFQENGVPTGIYFLKKGKVKKYKRGLNGKPQIFYICSEGELFGFHALLSHEYYADSAETLEECEIGFIPNDVFKKLYEQSDEIKDQIIRIMGHEYGVLVNHITIMAQYNVRERLSIILLLLNDKYKKSESSTTKDEINISREDLANFVGTARENLIRQLNELKAEKIITTKGRSILIDKPQELIKLSKISLL